MQFLELQFPKEAHPLVPPPGATLVRIQLYRFYVCYSWKRFAARIIYNYTYWKIRHVLYLSSSWKVGQMWDRQKDFKSYLFYTCFSVSLPTKKKVSYNHTIDYLCVYRQLLNCLKILKFPLWFLQFSSKRVLLEGTYIFLVLIEIQIHRILTR